MSTMAAVVDAQARLCPNCGARRDAAIGGALLPADWRCGACAWSPTFESGVALTKPEDRGRIVGVDPAAFAQLDVIEAGHFWFETRRALIVSMLNRVAPSAASYLEVGCGGGFVLASIAKARSWRHIVGVELHTEGLAIARARLPANVELIQASAETRLAESAFDVVGGYDVVEHIADDVGALAAMHRLLRPGGVILLTVPQHAWLWSASDDLALHQRRYRRGELEDKLRRTGFEILHSTSFNSLLLPLAMISRLAPGRSDDERLKQEGRPGAAVNAVLRGVLEAETALTRAGVRWPVGVSRLVAARKV